MSQQTLLCGHELVSPIGKSKLPSIIRRGEVAVFVGTYAKCMAYAKAHGLLRSQAPSAK